jgi:glycosyltransferase involved in cell wall biosynthesis
MSEKKGVFTSDNSELLKMKIGIISPVAWRTPPNGYGPWEQVASNHAEGLVKKGHEVTLFATQDSETSDRLVGTAPKGYEIDRTVNPEIWRALHIREALSRAKEFDVLHNHYDWMPLIFGYDQKTPMVTTIHGFSSEEVRKVYETFNKENHYVSISDSDRDSRINYSGTVYNGINLEKFTLSQRKRNGLLFLGRICYEKGTREAIEIAKRAGKKIIIAGIVQEEEYFKIAIKQPKGLEV